MTRTTNGMTGPRGRWLVAAGLTMVMATLAGVACSSSAPETGAAPDTSRWESDIQAFEAADQASAPPEGGVVFVGSSSIRLWRTLEEDFEGLPVINRGFGGSEMDDALEFADRIVIPYRPRMVVVYAGDNDLWSEQTPQQVFGNFQALVEKVHASLPETRVAFIAVKPSVARWSIADRVRETNALVEQYAASHPLVDYIDIFTPMLGPDGTPRPELFVEDGLHLNEAGYELWESVVEPVVRQGMAG